MSGKFWLEKKLSEFSKKEWEAICDNCGKCCAIKLQDEDDDEVYYTNVVCKYFNHENCRCKEYERRTELVPECLELDCENIVNIDWIPQTCSYKTLIEAGDLPEWHPLITGEVLEDKYSLRKKCVCELEVLEEDLEDYIVEDE